MKNRDLSVFASILLPVLLWVALMAGQPQSTAVAVPPLSTSDPGTTTRVSVSSDGSQGIGSSAWPALSVDGRYVAFDSSANNLVPGDTNGTVDVFVHDRQTGQTEIISVASSGIQAGGRSEYPALSADGRYVAFHSSGHLVPGDANSSVDIFVHDRQTRQTEIISVASDGTQGNEDSTNASISADGRYVAFESGATNLVPGDTNVKWDVFVHDRQTGQTERVSVASNGTQGNGYSELPAISTDGRYVAYQSYASTLVSGDTNERWDIFVHDRQTGQTERASITSDGTQGNNSSWSPALSADGRYVAFHSWASNLVPGTAVYYGGAFVHDRQTGQTEIVSVASDGTRGNTESCEPALSADGRYVAFYSGASNLVAGDTNGFYDVFVHDRQTGQTEIVSVAFDGTQANEYSLGRPSLSADGRYVAFSSRASNLVPGDTNGYPDIFVHERAIAPVDTTPPAAITNLAAGTGGNPSQIDLMWTAPGDNGNVGTASSYIVRYADSPIVSEAAWETATDVTGEPVPQPAGSSQIMSISGLVPGQMYYFAIKTEDEVPNTSGLSNSPGAAAGKSVDLSVIAVMPVQVIEGQELVLNKVTAVKGMIRKAGDGAASNVSVQVDDGSACYTHFYVAEPSNMDANDVLVADNSTHPLNFAADEMTKTIYFLDGTIAPTGDTFQASMTVDYLGAINETDEANNSALSDSFPVQETRWSGALFPDLYVHYFQADWGTTPIAQFDSYFDYTNSFLQGVFPVAEQRYTPDRSPIFQASSIKFRGSDGRLNDLELNAWMSVMLAQGLIAHPTADRFVAVVPSGWFASMTYAPGGAVGVKHPNLDQIMIAEARMGERPNGGRIAAHEIGHSYGLRTHCEEYAACNVTGRDRVGNEASRGLWVGGRIPVDVVGSERVYCFMGAYTDALAYWVDREDYAQLLADHSTAGAFHSSPNRTTANAILAIGSVDVTGTVTLGDWYTLPQAELSTLIPGPYSFEYRAAGGRILYQQPFTVSHRIDIGMPIDTGTIDQVAFVWTIPFVPGATEIAVMHGGESLATKAITANSPAISILEPNGGERIIGAATIQWSAVDGDGDLLTYAVLVSPNGGANWETLVMNLTSTTYSWDVSLWSPGKDYLIKVIATDGFNTGQDTSDAPFAIVGRTYLPIILRSR